MRRNVVDSSGIICFPKTVGETPAFVQIQIQIYKQENVTIAKRRVSLGPPKCRLCSRAELDSFVPEEN